MINFKKTLRTVILVLFVLGVASCSSDDDNGINPNPIAKVKLNVENVLQAKTLVESGTFESSDAHAPLTFPGESTSFTFSAAKGQSITFAAMYGWSNDLFFAPVNPGIALYDAQGNPIEGDVSEQVKLWDNGTRINQVPGANVVHPGDSDQQNIKEVETADDQGNTYLPAAQLINASLKYNGDSTFTLTLKNTSGGTANETPLSPGVWAVSYVAGGNLLNPNPLYEDGTNTYSGLTKLAEMGDNSEIASDIETETGIFTPLSPILVVVYNGIENPIFDIGVQDRGEGLTALAQSGNATTLADALKSKSGVEEVYVLPDPQNTVLLPSIGGNPGGKVSQELMLREGDKIAIATMYGFSNDWFFAFGDDGISADLRGDVSSHIKLYDDGTAVNQFPGAGVNQLNLGGTPTLEANSINEVPNPNTFTTLPDLSSIIKVTLN